MGTTERTGKGSGTGTGTVECEWEDDRTATGRCVVVWYNRGQRHRDRRKKEAWYVYERSIIV